jgi:antitoxin component of RelBE/YafQ-DinJ toxin-antitoxin module
VAKVVLDAVGVTISDAIEATVVKYELKSEGEGWFAFDAEE